MTDVPESGNDAGNDKQLTENAPINEAVYADLGTTTSSDSRWGSEGNDFNWQSIVVSPVENLYSGNQQQGTRPAFATNPLSQFLARESVPGLSPYTLNLTGDDRVSFSSLVTALGDRNLRSNVLEALSVPRVNQTDLIYALQGVRPHELPAPRIDAVARTNEAGSGNPYQIERNPHTGEMNLVIESRGDAKPLRLPVTQSVEKVDAVILQNGTMVKVPSELQSKGPEAITQYLQEKAKENGAHFTAESAQPLLVRQAGGGYAVLSTKPDFSDVKTAALDKEGGFQKIIKNAQDFAGNDTQVGVRGGTMFGNAVQAFRNPTAEGAGLSAPSIMRPVAGGGHGTIEALRNQFPFLKPAAENGVTRTQSAMPTSFGFGIIRSNESVPGGVKPYFDKQSTAQISAGRNIPERLISQAGNSINNAKDQVGKTVNGFASKLGIGGGNQKEKPEADQPPAGKYASTASAKPDLKTADAPLPLVRQQQTRPGEQIGPLMANGANRDMRAPGSAAGNVSAAELRSMGRAGSTGNAGQPQEGAGRLASSPWGNLGRWPSGALKEQAAHIENGRRIANSVSGTVQRVGEFTRKIDGALPTTNSSQPGRLAPGTGEPRLSGNPFVNPGVQRQLEGNRELVLQQTAGTAAEKGKGLFQDFQDLLKKGGEKTRSVLEAAQDLKGKTQSPAFKPETINQQVATKAVDRKVPGITERQFTAPITQVTNAQRGFNPLAIDKVGGGISSQRINRGLGGESIVNRQLTVGSRAERMADLQPSRTFNTRTERTPNKASLTFESFNPKQPRKIDPNPSLQMQDLQQALRKRKDAPSQEGSKLAEAIRRMQAEKGAGIAKEPLPPKADKQVTGMATRNRGLDTPATTTRVTDGSRTRSLDGSAYTPIKVGRSFNPDAPGKVIAIKGEKIVEVGNRTRPVVEPKVGKAYSSNQQIDFRPNRIIDKGQKSPEVRTTGNTNKAETGPRTNRPLVDTNGKATTRPADAGATRSTRNERTFTDAARVLPTRREDVVPGERKYTVKLDTNTNRQIADRTIVNANGKAAAIRNADANGTGRMTEKSVTGVRPMLDQQVVKGVRQITDKQVAAATRNLTDKPLLPGSRMISDRQLAGSTRPTDKTASTYSIREGADKSAVRNLSEKAINVGGRINTPDRQIDNAGRAADRIHTGREAGLHAGIASIARFPGDKTSPAARPQTGDVNSGAARPLTDKAPAGLSGRAAAGEHTIKTYTIAATETQAPGTRSITERFQPLTGAKLQEVFGVRHQPAAAESSVRTRSDKIIEADNKAHAGKLTDKVIAAEKALAAGKPIDKASVQDKIHVSGKLVAGKLTDKVSASLGDRHTARAEALAGRIELTTATGRFSIKSEDIKRDLCEKVRKTDDFFVRNSELFNCADKRYLTGIELLLAGLATISAVARVRADHMPAKSVDIAKEALPGLTIESWDGDKEEETLLELAVKRNLLGNADRAAVLSRPKYLVQPGDTLTSIAEEIMHDAMLGWLILQINAGSIKAQWNGDVCLTELELRQEIELPVAQDIVEFYRSRPTMRYKHKRLVTTTKQSSFDRELLVSNFKNVINTASTGLRKPQESPAV